MTLVCLCRLTAIFIFAAAAADLRADGETEFVKQLLSRSMFRTAEDYCEQNQAQATDINIKAEWEQLLSDCHSAHAWVEPTVNRSGLMEHAIEHITEFLRANVIHPERELRLRLRQIELLIQTVRMQDQVEQAGHLMIRPISASVSRNPEHLRNRTQFLEQAQQLTDGLLRQLEQIRADLDTISVRHLRERSRIASAEISLLQSMILDPSAAQSLEKADELLRQLSRSVSDEELKFVVAVLGAEVRLVKRDFKDFELQQGVLAGLASTPGQKTSSAILEALGLLQQRQPTEALAMISTLTRTSDDPRLICMELECLLAVYETIRVLEKPDLQKTAEEQFRSRATRYKNRLQGVWLESASRIERRFDLVQSYGSEAAESVAIADQLEAEGKLLEASQSLERLLNPNQSELPASVRALTALKAGELNIRLKDWPKARGFLEQSKTLAAAHTSESAAAQTTDESHSAGSQPSTAAAADLLIAFCIGQTLNEPPDDVEYQNTLEQHLSTYPDSATAIKARQWLAQFLRHRDPHAAAVHYLALFQANPLDVPSLLECGRILTSESHSTIEYAGQRNKSSDDKAAEEEAELHQTIRENFLKAVATVIVIDAVPTIDRTELKLQATEIDLLEKTISTPAAEWQQLDQALTELKTAVDTQITESAKSNGTSTTGVSDLENSTRLTRFKQRVVLNQLIVTACSQTQSSMLTEYQQQLLQQSEPDREVAALRLHEFYRPTTSGPGHNAIARTISLLLADRIMAVTAPGWKPEDAGGTTSAETGATGKKTEFRLPLMQLFEIQSVAAQRSGNPTARDRLLTVLLNQKLTQSELARIAELMGPGVEVSATGSQTETLKRFWKTVLKSSPQGSDNWLEASLQAAQFAFSENQPAEARRILGVVDALYPMWGHADRKARAGALRKKLEESAP